MKFWVRRSLGLPLSLEGVKCPLSWAGAERFLLLRGLARLSVVMETFYWSCSEESGVPKVDSKWGGWGSGVTAIAMTQVDSAETKIRVVCRKGDLSGTPIYRLRCTWGTGFRGINQSGG